MAYKKINSEAILRALMAIALAAVFFVFLVPSGCGSSGGGSGADSADSAGSKELAPLTAEVTIGSVRDLGAVESSSLVLMRDCGFSAIFQGKSVWVFGDTFLEYANVDDRRLLCNSWSSTYDLDAGDGIAGFEESVDEVGAPLELFPLTEEEELYNKIHKSEFCAQEPCNAHWAIWPGSIVVDNKKGWAYVFYRKVHVEHGQFNFYHVGHSIAIWKNYSSPAERPIFEYVEGYPTLFFSEGEDGFGSAAMLLGKMVYVYGCELEEGGLVKPCHLGRVPIASILDRSAWSFYDGTGNWSPQVSQAVNIFDGNDMMSVFHDSYIDRYVAIYSQPMDTRVMIRTAVNPEGPWSNPMELFTALAPDNDVGWVYDALAHPEFSQDFGRIIYVTYSRQTGHLAAEMRLVAVELRPPY
jgi:hypothetical protein